MVTSPKLSPQNQRSFCRELRDVIGANKVKDDALVLATYSYDASPVPSRKPGFIVLPEGKEDVIETLKLANKYKIPVTVMAGGVSMAGYSIPSEGGIVLDMHRMDRIIEINTDSGYAVVETGCCFDRLTAALLEKGFRTLIPTAPGSTSPVGNFLSRPTTNLCNRHLDGIVDLEVVLPDGTEFSTGSSHFPNAGSSLRYGPFADLAGLYTCGYGTMGIVTKAALRIQTINEANRISVAAFDSYGDALDFVKEIINNNIPEHCIIWNWQLYEAFAVDTSSGAEVPEYLKGDPRTPPEGLPYCLVTTFLSGYEEIMVAYEKVLTRVARKHSGRTIARDEARKRFPIAMLGWDELYAKYHQIEPTFFGLGKYMVWIMITEPKDVKEMEKYAVEQLAEVGVAPVCFYSHPFDFGRSIFFRIFVFPDPTDEEMIRKVGAKFDEMFTTAMERYGAIPMRHKSFMPSIHLTGGFYEVLKRIKYALDPNNILNPGMGIFPEDE
ncbi:MAG: FAD-binding oxidoreductase [Dehalococcoidales bacterium]|nr:FAD-binding oxidoreductase [Dehalococcoidales bacterium]